MTSRRFIVAAIAIGAVVGVVWRANQNFDDAASDVFERVVSEHVRYSTPGGSQATTPKYIPIRWGRAAEWSVKNDEQFSTYKLWIEKRVPMYKIIKQSETHIMLRRTFEAEIYDLEVRYVESGDELQVRFTVTPW